jgi:transcription antitermination factor NusG
VSDTGETDNLRRDDRIKILAGTFEGFEAIVTAIDEANEKVSAKIWIFGGGTPVELKRSEVVQIPWRPNRDSPPPSLP